MSGRQRRRAWRSEEVGLTQPPLEQPFGSWSMFDDAEGNRFALEQSESDAP